MAEAFYKVGDILELDGNASFPRQFGMFPKDAKIRCLVLKCIKPGYEFIVYTLLVYKIDGSFDTVGINQKDIAIAAKRVGHIDISSFLSDEESAEPDYALFFAAATLAQAADLRNELDKIKKENEKLKVENTALSDTLSKSEAKAQSRLDRNEVLKRENEELRDHNEKLGRALSKSEERADSRLDRISFLMNKVDELENMNKKQKAECDEANHEISRLRTVIGGLNDVIYDLNTSKSEISDLFYSLRNALQTDDILESVNELKNENERLSNENGDLKTMNDELRKSIPEYNKLVLEHFACTEKIKKLEEENKKLAQKISCADNLLAEAANRLYQGRAHLNISAHN